MRPRFIYPLKFIPFECNSIARRLMSRDVVRNGENTFSQLSRPSERGFVHSLRWFSGDKFRFWMGLSAECAVFLFFVLQFCSFVLAQFKSIFFGSSRGIPLIFYQEQSMENGPQHDPCSSRK